MHCKCCCIGLLIVLGLGLPIGASAQGKRVALVIGNSAYATGPLANPVNDATDMAAALKKIGFETLLGRNADRKTMYRLIEQFGNDIRGAEIALFYYSGHGVQAGGENYLIPIGADITVAGDVELEAVGLGRIVGRMDDGGAGTNAIILDACRNNPFPKAARAMDRGLAVVGQKPPESIIVYATEAGETADDGKGRNGVFTAALLQHIARDEELTGILRDVNAEVRRETNQKQKPAKYDNLTHPVYLTGKAPVRAEAPVETATSGTLDVTSDPPGIRVSIDDGDAVDTPASVELSPGSHSIHPLESYVDGTYFLEQPVQWVSVPAGAKMAIPVKPQAAAAELAFSLVPEGCTVLVNGIKAGVTPLSPLSVKAGTLVIQFEQPGGPPLVMTKIARPNTSVTATWGTSSDFPVQLPRKNISLDGKTDSWTGIEPLYETGGFNPTFMGDTKIAFTKFYMCRNDKDLFWRVDFAETNPLLHAPKGIKDAIVLQLSASFETAKHLNIGESYNRKDSLIYRWTGVWSDADKKWRDLADPAEYKNSEKMIVGRIGMSTINRYCNGAVGVQIDLASETGHGWDSSISSSPRYVDFSK